jgi:xylulokinase
MNRAHRSRIVAGIDSSTQSTKVVLCDAEDGAVVGRGSAPHPAGTEADPAAWWAALQQAGDGLLERAAAVGVAGQQHGMVVLDEDGEVIRPALLWNDVRSAAAAAELVGELGGPQWWASETGSVPTFSFKAQPQIRERHAALRDDTVTWERTGS